MMPECTHRKTVFQLGAGAIGSFLIRHLAVLPGIGRVVIVDKDVFEPKNLAGQAILPGDVGRSKAQVLARKLRRINPRLEVRAIHAPLEDVPLGQYQGDIMILCLDSRRARVDANGIAWRMGMALIDTGVLNRDGWWARVETYVPGGGGPCIECAFDQSDYDRIERVFACREESPAPTDAPSFLGAMAAALGAAECRKLLEDGADPVAPGRRVLHELRTHSLRVAALRRNPDCRFDHGVLTLERGPSVRPDNTLEEMFSLARGARRDGCGPAETAAEEWIAVEGGSFVRRVMCTSCAACKDTLIVKGRLRKKDLTCRICGGGVMAPVSYATETRLLPGAELPRRYFRFRLSRIGVRPGDVIATGGESFQTRYFLVQGA